MPRRRRKPYVTKVAPIAPAMLRVAFAKAPPPKPVVHECGLCFTVFYGGHCPECSTPWASDGT